MRLAPSLAAMAGVMLLAVSTSAATLSAPHVEVTYDGIDEPQAKAIARTLSAARMVYADDFGFDMPETILCDVKCGAGHPTRLYTDGNDSVFLSLPGKSKLDQPGKSGVFNLYGMCHELGHIAMYRAIKQPDWITAAAAEGWAHFAGSAVVDRVYEIEGDDLWPDRYDYRQDGMARLDKALKRPSPSDIDHAAGQWQSLEAIVGRQGVIAVFRAWDAAALDPAKPVEALGAALNSAALDRKGALEEWWKSAAPLLVASTEASGFPNQTVAKAKLTGSAVTLALDDDSSDGKKSIAGGGHARKFAAPGEGDWYVVAVAVYGSRYGPPSSSSKFDLAICDAENKPINTIQKPFSAFRRGQDQWVRFEMPPTRVPGEFSICLNFRPTATNGVYVHWDSSTTGNSLTAVPGKEGSEFAPGDWMIRVELDQLKDADALKPRP